MQSYPSVLVSVYLSVFFSLSLSVYKQFSSYLVILWENRLNFVVNPA